MEISQVVYAQKAFNRSSIDRIAFIGLLWLENLQEVLYIDTFDISSIVRKSLSGLPYPEDH